MKIGLILAIDHERADFPPLGIGHVAASLNHSLPEVEVILPETLETLIAEKPDMVGISASTDTYAAAIEWAGQIKAALDVPIVLGGIHISLIPRSLKPCFDVAVIGEGEITMVELVQSYQAHKGLEVEALKAIRGLAFFVQGELYRTPPRPILDSLETIPLPDRHCLPYYQRGGQAHVFSARGCPYDCHFCASSKFFERYRSHSIDTIVNDIDFLIREEKSEFIVFFDDLFIAHKPRLREIIDRLEQRHLLGKSQFMGHVRANLINEEVCALLKRLGMNTVSIGLESFSDKILRYYNKRGVTAAVNQRALDILAQYGINVLSLFIFGAPVETAADMHATFEQIHRNIEAGKIRDGQWGTLLPYPGTKIWDEAAARGLVHEQMDWNLFRPEHKHKLYLDELVPREALMQIAQEWKVKNTALISRLGPGPHTNLYYSDEKEFANSLTEVYERRKHELGSRTGDDLLMKAKENRYWYTLGQNYSFLGHLPEAQYLEGQPGQAAVWSATLDGKTGEALFLQPPAQLQFTVPASGTGVLQSALCLHPDVWDNPEAGACRFRLRVDGQVLLDTTLDPCTQAQDRAWQEFQVTLSPTTQATRQVVFETQAVGGSESYRWALWRAPVLFNEVDPQDVPSAPPLLPEEVSQFLKGAETAFLRDDFQATADCLQQALALTPSNAEIINAYGNVLLKLEQVDAARREFAKSTVLAPWYAPGYLNLAVVKLMQADEAGAKESIRQALELDPTQADILQVADLLGVSLPVSAPAGQAPPPLSSGRLEGLLGAFEERSQLWSELGSEHIVRQLTVGSPQEQVTIIPRLEPVRALGERLPVPPPDLRMGYHIDDGQKFLELGQKSYASLMRLLAGQQVELKAGDALLDWGCATGRVLRYFAPLAPAVELWGSDVDEKSMHWSLSHLNPPFQFVTASSLPHLPFPDGKFTFLYGLSVLTHITSLRDLWLLELARLLKPGGCAILTVHDEHTWALFRRHGMPGWMPEAYRTLEMFPEAGMEIRGNTWFYTYTFFHSDYIRRSWGQYFEVAEIVPEAEDYQTAVVLRKR